MQLLARGVSALTLPVRAVWRAAQLWLDADGLRMSAAMSFYGVLSLAPLLVLLVAGLGWWLDRELLEQGLIGQIGTIVGEQGAGVIREALASARRPQEGLLASAIGLAILLFGATGVFGELQSAFERLWSFGRTAPLPPQAWYHSVTLRLRGVGYVMAFGFLLLVSLAVSTLLNLLSGWAGERLALERALWLFNELLGFAVCAALFMGLMRMSAGPKPGWRHLFAGALVGATLFTLGRHLLAAYLSTAAVVSAYGAAGSLVVLLMWIYFSAAVLLFGAGCARALAEELAASAQQAAAGAPAPASLRPAGAPAGAH